MSGGVSLFLIIRRIASLRVRGMLVLGVLTIAVASGAHAERPGADGGIAENGVSTETIVDSSDIASGPDVTNGRDANAPLAQSSVCLVVAHGRADYVICSFVPAKADLRLFLNDESGKPYGHFNWVKEALAERGETLLFAMNAGMYHETRAPVGLYVEDSETLTPLNNNDGPGNFHLKPNGVFYIDADGGAHVSQTRVYLPATQPRAQYATQSGPMLVIDGKIHPRFLKDSTSRKRRNGVGVTADGDVIFALADTPVTFHEFARVFRDELKTPNALYLDGTVSRLYAPELGRNDPGVKMGPIVGVVVKRREAEE